MSNFCDISQSNVLDSPRCIGLRRRTVARTVPHTTTNRSRSCPKRRKVSFYKPPTPKMAASKSEDHPPSSSDEEVLLHGPPPSQQGDSAEASDFFIRHRQATTATLGPDVKALELPCFVERTSATQPLLEPAKLTLPRDTSNVEDTGLGARHKPSFHTFGSTGKDKDSSDFTSRAFASTPFWPDLSYLETAAPVTATTDDPFAYYRTSCPDKNDSDVEDASRMEGLEKGFKEMTLQFAEISRKTDAVLKQLTPEDKASVQPGVSQPPATKQSTSPPHALPRVGRRTTPVMTTTADHRPAFIVPVDVLRNMANSENKAISDSVLAPKAFRGGSDQDPERWLEYFNRYCEFRKLSATAREELFKMMLQDAAADWLVGLPRVEALSLPELQEQFRKNYFRSPQLQWKDASDLWGQGQQPTERVQDFVIRLRRAAKRLNLTPELTHHAFIHGLRPKLRLAVVQQGLKSLERSIEAAHIAEAAAESSDDPVPSLLLQALRDHTAIASKQSEDLKHLTSCVASLMAGNTQRQAIAVMTEPTAQSQQQQQPQRRFNNRPLKQTPQNQQRERYAQQNSTHSGGQRSVSQPTVNNQQPLCRWCGRAQHQQRSECPAQGQQCRHCGKQNHFAAVCRSSRPDRA